MKKLIILICVLVCVGCAEAYPVVNPEIPSFFAIEGFTEKDTEIVKEAIQEWGMEVTESDSKASLVSLGELDVSGRIWYGESKSTIVIGSFLQEWGDWEKRLKKIVLHEVGHHIAYYNCGKDWKGHIGDGNIMASTPERQSETITLEDIAFVNCEIAPLNI